MGVQEKISKLKNNQRVFLCSIITPEQILEEVQKNIISNFDIILDAFRIDNHNQELSKEKILRQLDIAKLEQANTFKNEFGKVTHIDMPYGVLGVISNCNVYNALRLMVLAISSRSALIIDITNNIGAIYMLINEFNNVLNKMGLGELIELYHHNEGTNLEDIEELDGIIYIGKKTNAERIRMSLNKPIIYSGCGNYEMYIENNLDNELMKKAISMGNIKVYSKKGIGIGQEVSGLEEAIARINESGNEYGVGIIAESRESAKKFVNEIKARNVFVNALPTLIDDQLDFEIEDLVYKKSVLIYE